MKFFINQDAIKALLLIAAKDDLRGYLNAICFDVRAHDAVAVVTDGYRMLAMPIQPDDDAGPVVPGIYVVNRSLFDIRGQYKGFSFGVEFAERRVTVSVGAVTTTGEASDFFPDWRRVVPLATDGQTGVYNTEYLDSFTKAHRLLGASKGSFPTVWHNGTGSARISLAANAVGVLMPIRRDPEEMPVYDWLRREDVPAAAAA